MSAVKNIIRKIMYALPSSYVLMFHHVTSEPEIQCSGCVLDEDKFYEITDMISCFDSLENVLRQPSGRKAAITFDDGLADVYTVAYPYLIQKGIPFTIFPVTDFLDKPGYITTAQLAEMSKNPLVTVGSHGVSHEIFTKMSSAQKKDELVRSKALIEDKIGRTVNIFAYSHGQNDKETRRYAKCYKYALATSGRPLNFITKQKMRIPRINIENKTYEAQKKLLTGWLTRKK